MRKFILAILLFITSLFFLSCEEEFSPKEEHVEEYILNCIIDGRSNFHTAAVLKSFDVNNFDPSSSTFNPFLTGADIKLKYRGQTYSFNDTIMTSLVNQRFTGPIDLYYLNNFNPDRNDELLEIEATLPNGKVLTAEAITPISFGIDYGESTRQLPPEDNSSTIRLFWQPISYKYFQYYVTRMSIKYSLTENGVTTMKSLEVPVEYISEGDSTRAAYPKPSRMISTTYPMEVFDRAMEKLAPSHSQRSNVSVSTKVIVEVLTFDANLAAYYFAGLSENLYTVRIDDIIYSNVDGGYGIFGVTWQEDFDIRLLPSYIQRFGYNVMD